MTDGKPSLDVQYKGAPSERASFDKLISLLRHTCLPAFAGTVDGDSIFVAVKLFDAHGAKFEAKGQPAEIGVRFNSWLKDTYNIIPLIP